MEFTERFWDREPTVLLCGLKPVATSPGSVSFLLYLLAGTVQATTNFICGVLRAFLNCLPNILSRSSGTVRRILQSRFIRAGVIR
jgi:hypothetical protein